MGETVLLFDGVCNLCNNTVQFVIKRDKTGFFKFASLQSEYGQNFLLQNNLPNKDFDTFILIQGETHFIKSTAILKVIKNLNGLWPVLYLFIIIPRFIRDPLYSFIAKNRYRVFGKRESCMIPDKSISSRFLA